MTFERNLAAISFAAAFLFAITIPARAAAPHPVAELSPLLGRHLAPGEVAVVRRHATSPDETVRALAAALLYRTDPQQHGDALYAAYAVRDYAERAKGRREMTTPAEFTRRVDELEKSAPNVSDRRLVLLYAFLAYRQRNVWVEMKDRPPLSAARFFRGAFLAAAFEGSGVDALAAANAIDRRAEEEYRREGR